MVFKVVCITNQKKHLQKCMPSQNWFFDFNLKFIIFKNTNWIRSSLSISLDSPILSSTQENIKNQYIFRPFLFNFSNICVMSQLKQKTHHIYPLI